MSASISPRTSDNPQAAVTALSTFVACAQQMLDPATPESRRRQAEARLLAQLRVVHALGVFDLFSVRDPALAALLRDELERFSEHDVNDRGYAACT